MTYRQLGTWIAIGIAFFLALATMSLAAAGCGENTDGCTRSSSPMLGVILSWAGLAGVVTFGFVHAGPSVAIATVAAYVAWLVVLFA